MARGSVFAISTVLASAAGMVVLFATAAFADRPVIFLGAGWITFAVGVLATSSTLPRSSRQKVAVFTIVALTTVGAAALLTPGPRQAPMSLDDYQLIGVSSGARLAVAKIAAKHPTKPPIVVLHGGPGVPDLEANKRAFAPLADAGADVYLYAQLGNGASSHLSDPRGYSLERDTTDLEALRDALGLDRMVLIGHSYGGALAAQYLVDQPDKVAALILISPMPLNPDDRSPGRLTARLGLSQRVRLYRSLSLPRSLTAYALLQINPRAAHAYLPDAEADFRNDIVVGQATPALHCPGSYEGEPVRGTGFYAAQFPQSAAAKKRSDIRASLSGKPVSTLIMKGSCDYLSWSSALEYRDLLPNSSLLYFSGAGHNLHQENMELVSSAIIDFLDQKPLPVPKYIASFAPPDYQGSE